MKKFKHILVLLTLFLFVPGVSHALDFTAGSNELTVDSAASRGLVAADFNDDGDIDIYVANRSEQNQLWLSDGSGGFTESNIAGDLVTDVSHEALTADLNGDGFADIYVLNIGAQNRVWINDGSGSFTEAEITGDTGSTYGGALGDVDGDGDIDLYAANLGANKLWINDGTGEFTANDIALDSGNTADAIMVDVDGDGDLDIYAGNYGANKLWINDGTGEFTANDIALDSGSSYGLAYADVDGDGDNDLYAANDGAQNKLWINDGTGEFTANDIALDTGNSRKAAFADLDNDGDQDLYVVNSGVNKIWINDGTGSFMADNIAGDNGDSNAVLLFDIDEDGDKDIFVANSGEQNLLWINNYIVIVESAPAVSRKGGRSIRYICEDPKASNYNDTGFGRHKASVCEYDVKTTVTSVESTTDNPFAGTMCSSELMVTDNMKMGDKNGNYSAYNKGVVTQVSLLQTHMNRLLKDEYGVQAAGPVDQWFGNLTKQGVKRLQTRLNALLPDMTPLIVDGIVGTYTKKAINMSC